MSEKNTTFTMKLELKLRNQFMKAAATAHRPASQLVRDFMRTYIEHEKKRQFAAEAHRQSVSIAKRAATADTDEHAMMREIAAELDQDDLDE